MIFRSLQDMINAAAAGVRQPERLTVAEAAEKYRELNNVGSYVGMWDNTIAPYLVEPMEVLTSTDYLGMVFAGPARTGKSDMFFNWLGHTAICDPADMLMIHMTMNVARDWSAKDLRRVFRHSPKIGATVAPGRGTHDIKFLSGMHLQVKWPAISELSGKTVPRVWLADYDRMPESVDGEGSPYDLGAKRTTTFRRNGMTVAESSPGYEIDDPKWMQKTPHEAPPTKGILALYNRGDRRRLYWRCPHCAVPFEPDFKLLQIPNSADHVEAAENTALMCPHCTCLIFHDARDGLPGKNELNQMDLGNARWVRDGEIWTPWQKAGDNLKGSVEGKPFRSDIASFWMKGPAAVFTTWRDLALKWLKAMEEYERTGSQESLRTTVNTDQGLPYLPRGLEDSRSPDDLKNAAEHLPQREVPEDVRWLQANVDVQKRRFVVQVTGQRPYGDIVVIDRFDIRKSKRTDEDGDVETIAPATYLEDWDALIERVILADYPLADGSGKRMKISYTACDSGGAADVKNDSSTTKNAYDFYRRLRDHDGSEFPRGLHRRFQLVKGNPNINAPRVYITWPDSARKDRHANARGEIPVLLINTNVIKDQLDGLLDRTKDGGGRVIFPRWLPDWFWQEVCSEIRTTKGWEKLQDRNEAWDLLVYHIAMALHHFHIERIDWTQEDALEGYALPWDRNTEIFDPEEVEEPYRDDEDDDDESLEALAAALA
ncbi:terminase large subunit [Pseudomonas phage PspYZU01]|uniref:Terminase, large subunit n=1 Tax=Pseudomonas phage PspYZU01 TaxID=1983555 RepID=A0A2U7NJD4_9CAUD|nr:terminase large subunit [Pseudomonas phage PspYZU01]ASD51934.1 hypothetical protein PspYZU01_49 [Pseudomonas phage PspYZU01]